MKDKIGLIVARMKEKKGLGSSSMESGGSEDSEMDSGDEYGTMGKEAAAEAVLSATKSGSASELASALTSFFDLCGEKENESDE